jgi:hypothetical protein
MIKAVVTALSVATESFAGIENLIAFPLYRVNWVHFSLSHHAAGVAQCHQVKA